MSKTKTEKIKLVYTIKDQDGFIYERVRKFPTPTDANVYLKLLQTGGQLVGKPTLVLK